MTAATLVASALRDVTAWVDHVAELATPDHIVWCDGSAGEWRSLTALLVDNGTFAALPDETNSVRCVSDPEHRAWVANRTYICCEDEANAGPANKWMDPVDMKTILTEEYRGAMSGRTMYVIAFCGGPLDAAEPRFGVQITDSAHVAASMYITNRSGALVWARFEVGTDFMRCLHSVGSPLHPGQADVPWPSDRTKYFAHFPQDNTIWSYGSGFAETTMSI